MRTIKYILSVWTILSLSLFCFSCMEEEVSKSDDNWSDGKTLKLTLNTPKSRVVSPMTKSAQADTILFDLNVLIYENGTLTRGFYYDGNHEVISQLKSGATKQLNLELPPDTKGSVYAVANYGNDIYTANVDFENEDDLKNARFNIDGVQPKKYMYADGGSFNVSDPSQNKKSLELTRIYALVTVKVEKKLIKPTGVEFDIVPTSLQIKNIPTEGQFAADNKIISNRSGSADGEMLLPLSGDESNTNFLSEDHAAARAFYLYENRQPDGSSLNNNTDQTTKTPAGMPADEIISIIKTNRTCSYIEMNGKYILNGNETGLGSGSIVYRFFLGKDIFKDFDVERNVHYQVTLTLNGKGGADEATWRVETELIGEIQVQDVYVGYRAGSKTRMYITGTGIDHIKETKVEVTHVPPGGSNAGYTVTEIKKDAKGAYVEVQAAATNTHDYQKKTGLVTFRVQGPGIDRSFKAKIYQVPRLVDPIAFYKKADNVEPVHIRVKEYDPDQRAYIDLNSKGPWTATIKYSAGTANNWYKIYNTDESGNEIQGTDQSSEGQVISGEGPVQFGYKPLSANTNTDGDGGQIDGARYGMIQVKYHNDWCEHEIYLRQGYQPTIMGDQGYAWSMFNCLGKKTEKADEVGTVTAYPTQTGWFFNGGVDIAMHPFKPGWNVNQPADLEYSNGTKGFSFAKYPGNVNAWGYQADTETDLRKATWRGERGPCPEGYVVPTATTYRTLTNITEIYTGYVHDDDPVKGWRYGANSEGALLDDNNHCNPAKGSLFINKTDRYTNVFFSFGKGVKSDAASTDPKLIPEIGVGRRTDGTNMALSTGYFGFYWNGTSFADVSSYWHQYHGISVGSGSDHMGKVDFGYDVFSKEPNLLDVPGYFSGMNEKDPAVGIDRHGNGSFVRCVKDLKPFAYRTITLAGKFFHTGTQIPFNGSLEIEFYLKTNTEQYPRDAFVEVKFVDGLPVNPIVSIPLRGEVADYVVLRTGPFYYVKSTITNLESQADKYVNP